MEAIFTIALLFGSLLNSSQCIENIKIDIVRQERYNGCGNDFIGRDMHVNYRLTNNTKNPIYVFGFAYERGFFPTGYKLRFNEETHQWDYPTRNNQPVPWQAKSSLEKSVRKIEAGEFIEFSACHSTAEKGMKFARSVYVSCDPKSAPTEYRSDGYIITSLK